MGSVTEAACAQRAFSCYKNAMEKEDMAQAPNLSPCQLPCKQWGKRTHQRLLEEGKPKHRGPREVWDSS